MLTVLFHNDKHKGVQLAILHDLYVLQSCLACWLDEKELDFLASQLFSQLAAQGGEKGEVELVQEVQAKEKTNHVHQSEPPKIMQWSGNDTVSKVYNRPHEKDFR